VATETYRKKGERERWPEERSFFLVRKEDERLMKKEKEYRVLFIGF
jgi:hypothetical protein